MIKDVRRKGNKCKFLHPPLCKFGKSCDRKKCIGVHIDYPKPKQKKADNKTRKKEEVKQQDFLERRGLKKMMEEIKAEIISEIRHQLIGTQTISQLTPHPPHPWKMFQ